MEIKKTGYFAENPAPIKVVEPDLTPSTPEPASPEDEEIERLCNAALENHVGSGFVLRSLERGNVSDPHDYAIDCAEKVVGTYLGVLQIGYDAGELSRTDVENALERACAGKVIGKDSELN